MCLSDVVTPKKTYHWRTRLTLPTPKFLWDVHTMFINGHASLSLHPSSCEMYIQSSPANAQRADWISIRWVLVCRSRVDVEHRKRETQFSAIKRARKLSTSSTWVYFSWKLWILCCESPSEDQVGNWTGKRTTKNVNWYACVFQLLLFDDLT